jgi:adenine/guanine phosphoribosyltransferase-like PRPP-binding protein
MSAKSDLRILLVILIVGRRHHFEIMQSDPVYLKAVRIWLEAHGHAAAAATLSAEIVAECQADGLPIAEAAAEVLRLATVLEIAGK